MTRGLTNNNPGNIRLNNIKWQGMSETQEDRAFVQFVSPEWGIRAMARILTNYQKDGLGTIKEIIHRWAPPVENHTESYVAFVCKQSGLDDDREISLRDDIELFTKVVKAMIRIECGSVPYDDALITKGITMSLI